MNNLTLCIPFQLCSILLWSQAELYWVEETTLYLLTVAEVLLDPTVASARRIHNENIVSAHKVHS